MKRVRSKGDVSKEEGEGEEISRKAMSIGLKALIRVIIRCWSREELPIIS